MVEHASMLWVSSCFKELSRVSLDCVVLCCLNCCCPLVHLNACVCIFCHLTVMYLYRDPIIYSI